ncbi:putative membrane protein [Synechococcus sp. A15-60]|nr:putative membrane protein [Synechococcus sp. A15-60]
MFLVRSCRLGQSWLDVLFVKFGDRARVLIFKGFRPSEELCYCSCSALMVFYRFDFFVRLCFYSVFFGWFDMFLFSPCLLRFWLPGGVYLCNKS